MKCDEKGCQHTATVHLTEIVNDKVTKLHLCEECAQKKGVEMEQHFGIADLLQGITEGPKATPKTAGKAKCTQCGMVYEDFKKIGRLGCSDCYQTFEQQLAPLLKRIHGAQRHLGKSLECNKAANSKPKTISKQVQLDILKGKLRQAVESEKFEDAAFLRDEIIKLNMQTEESKS